MSRPSRKVATVGVARDHARRSWFWAAWLRPIDGKRTEARPIAHGHASSPTAAKSVVLAAVPEGWAISENDELVGWLLGRKPYAAPSHKRALERVALRAKLEAVARPKRRRPAPLSAQDGPEALGERVEQARREFERLDSVGQHLDTRRAARRKVQQDRRPAHDKQ